MTAKRLPALMTERQIAEELDIPRRTARSLMVRLEKVRPEGVRRVFVRRADVIRALGLDDDKGAT